LRKTALAGLALGLLASFGAATASLAAIVDVNAQTATGLNPATFTFTPGTYQIEYVGTADGGAYDAYKLCSTCAWQLNLLYFEPDEPVQPDLVRIGSPTGVGFATAADALAGFQGPSLLLTTIPYPYSGAGASSLLVANPWIVEIEDTVTVGLFIGDQGDRTDNVGGASLRISAVGVPEPSTWALMILGFGAAGAVLRRRRATFVAVPS
jgi:PEP-CTERM motif-containing protein